MAASTHSLLPRDLQDVLDVLPKHSDKRDGAEVISKHLFKVSHRTLERWPLEWRHVNGKAVTPTAELLLEAWRRFSTGPVVKSGQQQDVDVVTT